MHWARAVSDASGRYRPKAALPLMYISPVVAILLAFKEDSDGTSGIDTHPGFADWEYAFIAGTASPFYGIDTSFFASATGQFRSQG